MEIATSPSTFFDAFWIQFVNTIWDEEEDEEWEKKSASLGSP